MTREDFLRRVRDALGRSPGDPAEAPPTPFGVAGSWEPEALVAPFMRELEAVGGRAHRAADPAEAATLAARIAREEGAASYVRSTERLLDSICAALGLPAADDPARADLGVSGALCGIAATGSLVLSSRAGRLASLLPATHLAVLRAEQLVPTLSEALELRSGPLPSAWTLATGPSRTADIELTLSTGVHGPGRVHVIVIGRGP